MKIVVCIRQGLDGEINPFDACAYEEALRIDGAEVTVLSMGALPTANFLKSLTRLGASRAILLSDKMFAGADTLATAYALAKAIKKLTPDLVFCGRQTLVGDTAQTGPMLAVKLGFSLVTNVMGIKSLENGKIVCDTRNEGEQTADFPALLTVERINDLRLPRLGSKMTECEIWSGADIEAEVEKCGLKGSPTRVISTKENESGKRKCKFIAPSELETAISEALQKNIERTEPQVTNGERLSKVITVGEAPLEFARLVSDDITVIDFDTAENLAETIKQKDANAVLWGSDTLSKRLAAKVAAILELGLCADCTSLETDGKELFMIRPALSGSVIAKIRSVTIPAMATVRTAESDTPDIIVGVGFGAKDSISKCEQFAKSINAGLATTRKAVDNSYMPYNLQVGLTGKTVSPPVYIAVGISGAVHHIVGMKQAGTVIAVNPDKEAPIFDYADYGILANVEDVIK